VEALVNKGESLSELGRLGDARTVLEKSVSLRPNEVEAIHSLAEVYLKLGRRDAVLEQCKKLHERGDEREQELLSALSKRPVPHADTSEQNP
jgi:tetratricopeptide (TPR) repeat protein